MTFRKGIPMRLVSCLVLALFLCTMVLGQNSSGSAPSSLPKLERFSPDQGDKAADPCNDFFQYACGKWIKANPIPPDQPGWGTFNSLAIWNLAALRETLEDASKASSGRTPIQQKAGDYYAACMNEQAINQAGVAPLQPLLDRIAALHDKSELPALIAYIHQRIRPANLNFIDAQYQGVVFGTYAIADFNNANQLLGALDQSGMNMPSREFYLKDDDKSKQIREQYLQHVTRMLQLVGETQAQAAADAQTTLKMETAIANSAMDIVVRRDPKNLNNKMTLEQVQALTPSFDWKAYFAAMHAPPSPGYLVISPQHFRGLGKLISSESIENWRAYLHYSTLHYLASSLSQPFVDENFAFYGRILNGSETIQARSRRCSSYADSDIGEVVGQAYAQKYFPPENKQRMLTMVKAIEAALHQDIDSRTWMSDKTKKLAHAKLQAQVDKIGYPDKWRDYSSLEIRRDDFLGNVERSAAFEINWRISSSVSLLTATSGI
jgi:putative endopeptidase